MGLDLSTLQSYKKFNISVLPKITCSPFYVHKSSNDMALKFPCDTSVKLVTSFSNLRIIVLVVCKVRFMSVGRTCDNIVKM